MTSDADEHDNDGVDPRELLRKMLQISPEDAEAVRRDSPTTRKRTGTGQGEGPTADYGTSSDKDSGDGR